MHDVDLSITFVSAPKPTPTTKTRFSNTNRRWGDDLGTPFVTKSGIMKNIPDFDCLESYFYTFAKTTDTILTAY